MTPPTGAIPPTLPPSVEEAYRRKCIQLKQRTNEIEETNDAARLRLTRMGREIEKLRLERAFLLESLAKRTSTNVEDSDGSPSPPSTSANDGDVIQPKEKPLRTKRGHRKPSFLANIGDGRAGSTFVPQGPITLSPSSDAFSHTHPDHSKSIRNATPQGQTRRKTENGTSDRQIGPDTQTHRPKSAFDVYCNETRSVLSIKYRYELAEGTMDMERVLAEGWRKLTVEESESFQKRYDQIKTDGKNHMASSIDGEIATHSPAAPQNEKEDEDVEMGEESGSPVVATGDVGGFTAVNPH